MMPIIEQISLGKYFFLKIPEDNKITDLSTITQFHRNWGNTIKTQVIVNDPQNILFSE